MYYKEFFMSICFVFQELYPNFRDSVRGTSSGYEGDEENTIGVGSLGQVLRALACWRLMEVD